MAGENKMNEKDLGEFEFIRETVVSIVERPKSKDVYAVCLETDDERLLVPLKIYKIGLRGNKVRVIDEKGEAAIYPQSFFLVISLPDDTTAIIEEHHQINTKFAEEILV